MFGNNGKAKRSNDNSDVSDSTSARLDQIIEALRTECQDLKSHFTTALQEQSAKHMEQMLQLSAQHKEALKAQSDRFEAKLTAELDKRDQQQEQLRLQVRQLQAELARSVGDVEAKVSRRSNLVVQGVPESVAAPALAQFASERCAHFLGQAFPAGAIVEARRLGRRAATEASSSTSAPRPRPVLVRFSNPVVRDLVLNNKRKFTTADGKKLYLDSDLTPTEQKKKRELGATYRALKQHNLGPSWRDAVLWYRPDQKSDRAEQHPANWDPTQRLNPQDTACAQDAPMPEAAA